MKSSPAVKKIVTMTLEQVVAALDVLPIVAFPNAVAVRAAAILVAAVNDERVKREELDKLCRERRRIQVSNRAEISLEKKAIENPDTAAL